MNGQDYSINQVSQAGNNELKIDVCNLKPGVYILITTFASNTITHKFIKR